MPLISIRGVRIHAQTTGEGPPLVLTTGQGTGPEARAELVTGLSAHFRVLTYDQRGSGRSEPAPQNEPMEGLAEDIACLMDAFGMAQAAVIGHSTGAGKATCLANRHPSKVSRLVLAAPWTHADPQLQSLQDLRKAAARTLPPAHYTHFNALLLYPPDYRRTNAPTFERLVQQAPSKPQDADGMAARLDSILALDARPLYAQIRCPTLVLGARDDLVMPLWHAQDAARRIPGAQLGVLDDGGHMFPETRTAQFLGHVLPHLCPSASS